MESRARIFVSREIEDIPSLAEFCQSENIELVAKSFIDFEFWGIEELPHADWIFLASPTAVRMFCDNYSIGEQKLAVLGEGSNKVLESYGHTATFIGAKGKEPGEIGRDFLLSINVNDKVLFPVSNLSRGTVTNQVPEHNRIEFPLYETSFVSAVMDGEFDLYLFTSPSNADAYINSNSLSEEAIILCLGETSKQHLNELGLKNRIENVGPLEENWIERIRQII